MKQPTQTQLNPEQYFFKSALQFMHEPVVVIFTSFAVVSALNKRLIRFVITTNVWIHVDIIHVDAVNLIVSESVEINAHGISWSDSIIDVCRFSEDINILLRLPVPHLLCAVENWTEKCWDDESVG